MGAVIPIKAKCNDIQMRTTCCISTATFEHALLVPLQTGLNYIC